MNREAQDNMRIKGGIRYARRIEGRAAFAASFRNWRQVNNLTLKEVAFDLGISVSAINSWEMGLRFPSGRHLEMLIDYTGRPPCWFFCVKNDDCVQQRGCKLGTREISSNTSPLRPAISTLSRI